MCIGVPMQVIECGPIWAWCDDGADRVQIDMRLVGPQPPGTWVLTFLGTARETLGETQALLIRNALAALAAVAQGQPVDHLFADLVGREPQLPEHLRRH